MRKEWAAVALAVVAVASSLHGARADVHEPSCPPKLLETLDAGSIVCFSPNATGYFNPGQNEIVAVTVNDNGVANVTNTFTANGGGYDKNDFRCFTWLATNANTPVTTTPGSGTGAKLDYTLYSFNGHTNTQIITVLNSVISQLVDGQFTQTTTSDGRAIFAWGLSLNADALLSQLKSNVALLAYEEARSLAAGTGTWDVVIGWNVQMWENLTQPITYQAPPALSWGGNGMCPISAQQMKAVPFHYQNDVMFKATISAATHIAVPSIMLLALLAAATALGRRD